MATDAKSLIIRIYFTLVSAGTLIALMIGAIGLIGYGLRTVVFPSTNLGYLEICSLDMRSKPLPEYEKEVTDTQWLEQCEKRNTINTENNKRQQASQAVDYFATLLVALPLFILHFRFVYRDWMNEKK